MEYLSYEMIEVLKVIPHCLHMSETLATLLNSPSQPLAFKESTGICSVVNLPLKAVE